MYKKAISLILLLLAYPALSPGQQLTFEHFKVEAGLSQNSVLSITQDQRGFIWAGTRNGLNRFDGTHFKIYRSGAGDTHSLSSGYINTLFYDSHRRLWAGTSAGLNLYREASDDFVRFMAEPGKKGGLSNHYIRSLGEDVHGRLWVGSNDGLYMLTDAEKNTFQKINLREPSGKKIKKEEVLAIFQDSGKNIWVGTSTGLVRLTPQGNRFIVKIFNYEKGAVNGLNDDYVTAFCEDAHHRLWIGTLRGGLNLYHKDSETFSHFTAGTPRGIVHNNVRKIVEDPQGKLWIATLEGLSIFDPETKTSVAYRHRDDQRKSLTHNSIYAILKDTRNSFWLGTYYGGLNVSHPQTIPFKTYQNSSYYTSINDNVISSFNEDEKQNLWIGTEGGGLNYLNRSSGQFKAYKSVSGDPSTLGSNLIKVLHRDKDGNLWAGTHAGGLNLFNRHTGKFTRYIYRGDDSETFKSEISSILDDHRNRLWVCTQKGLRLFQRTGMQLDSIASDAAGHYPGNPRVLFEDSDKTIWMGYGSGLYSLKANSQEARHPGLDDYVINSIMEDRTHRLWIGTNNGFVLMDKSTGKFTFFTTKDGLCNNQVLGILEDKNDYLWLSTANGLSRFDPVKRQFKNFNTSDGLPGNEFNNNAYFKSSSGELFFGGINGFVSFMPDQVATNEYEFPIAFTGLRLFNDLLEINGEDGILKQNLSGTRELVFRHDQDAITVEFALLNYLKPDKNKYAYKLEGFNKDWNYVNTPSATYTNLPAGSYTLWVKGANNDGVWSQPAQLKIRVLPPFWKTWWAYSLYVLAISGLVFFISRFFYLRALLHKENELHQFKLNFFTNISHEIRTHLSLIVAPLDKIVFSGDENKKQISTIKKNAGNLLQLVNELMDFRKVESNHLTLHVTKNDVIRFTEDVVASFNQIAALKHIETRLDTDLEHPELYFDEIQMGKVLYNLLSNAFKFTPEGGSVRVEILEKNDVTEVKVIDNGRGISPENLEKLFVNYFQEEEYGVKNTGYGIGLALSKSIVEMHKGKLSVQSGKHPLKDEHQTIFTVSLRQGKGHFAPELLSEYKPEQTLSQPLVSDYQKTGVPASVIENKDKKYTIQLVEDNAEVRAFIAESLGNAYHVVESENGQKGFETAVELIPDLIVSDVMMPVMSGFELCEKLKSDARTSHIPVLLLTAQTAQEHQISGLEFGADIYLTKPFSLQILELHIRNLLLHSEKLRQRYSQGILAAHTDKSLSLPGRIDSDFLLKMVKIIEENLENPDFNLVYMSREAGMSQPVLYKKIKALTDMTVNDFVKSIRLKQASMLLQQKDMSVNEIAFAVGFDDRRYFSREFKKQFGVLPNQYAEKA